jgi:iron complex outermembrane receptor protein
MRQTHGHRRSVGTWLSSCVLAMLLIAPTVSVAQDTAAEPAADAAPEQIEEVIVTATKRETSLREIPASVAAIGGAELEQRGAQGLEDIVRLVPGVNLTTPSDGATRVTIRGIAAEANTNPTAGILFGNVSFSDAFLPRVTLDPNPFDLKSVEVLKGPQGTLFGAGALNGAIRYVPEGPQFGVQETKYFAQYITLDHGAGGPAYGAALNLPIGDGEQFALRLVGFDREAPGWVDNKQTGRSDVNRIDQSGARGILGWRPSQPWDISLMVAWQQTDARDLPVTDNDGGDLSVSNKPRSSPSHRAYDLASLSVRYDLDAASFVSESAYTNKWAHNQVDASSRLLPGGPLPILAQNDDSHSGTWSQELRLVSRDAPESKWRWVAGVFASHQDIGYTLAAPIGDASIPLETTTAILNAGGGLGDIWLALGQPNYLNLATDVVVKELAAFGDLTRRLGDLELSVGGRLYQTTSGGVAQQNGLLLALTGGGAEHRIDEQMKESGFNPKLSLLWHASDNVIEYAAISRGFRVGGVQPGFSTALAAAPAPDSFKSDSIWNYEIGTRTQWLDQRLRFDLTAFLEEWKDPQTLEFDPSGLITYIDNIGGVESRGLEAALQALLPIRGLSFTATVAYTDARTTEVFNAANGQRIEPGSRWPLSPKWQTAETLAYARDLARWTLGGSITHSYMGKAVYGLSQPTMIFGYSQWDVQINASCRSLAWLPEWALIVNNLGDERGVSNSFSGATYEDVTYIQPRAVTLRLSGRF